MQRLKGFDVGFTLYLLNVAIDGNCLAGASKGFFDSSVGAQFANRAESPRKAAPAPRQSSPTRASSGGGFFDSSVGSQFDNRSESPKKTAPKQAAPTKASSGGGFFDSSVGSQFANRSESPKKAAPAPRQSSPTKASSGGFFDSSVGAQFANRSESPKKAAPNQAAPTAPAAGKPLTLTLLYSKTVSSADLCKH